MSPPGRARSVFTRFRLAGVSVIVGVGLVGGIFFGLLNSHYLSIVIARTLGATTGMRHWKGHNTP